MKKLLILFLFFFIATNINATHINGGYITYRYLGNDNYEITLVVYRDCYNGVPPFDDPASIGVFDNNNILIQNLLVPFTNNELLFVPSDCMPNTICFEKSKYVDTVNIFPSSLPVTIAYQRCCRSILIQNILDPSNTGMTFLATINHIDNNSAVFGREIPGFTFVGDNFIYDGSAFDIDGDSLVYSLTDFYNGATGVNPQPSPPDPPPYVNALWQTPYSLADIIGSNPPLSIDPATGIMTALPGFAGVFEVAEKVDEYRNGIWINSSRREFLLFINPANYYNIAGNVSVNGNTQSLDAGKSWLIRKNLYDSTLTATDTNDIVTGSYAFANIINGFYLLKASADSISPYYPNNIPTYFGDSLFWYQATELQLCSGDTQNVNINLVQGINPGGPGFVGGLISQGANKMLTPGDPESGITVILFNSANQPVAYAVTDNTGYFSISNLPFDTYKVYIDKLNAMIDNALAPAINLSATNPGSSNFSFTLFTDHLELNGFVGINEYSSNENFISLQPNPAKEKTIVKYFLNQSTDINIDIYDLYGRKIKTVYQKNNHLGEQTLELDFKKEHMKSGVYFIVLNAANFSKTIRITVI